MSHIHIYLPKGMTVTRTKDAGFDESKHKRDHGKFATTSGDAGHHEAEAAKHAAAGNESTRSSHVAAAHHLRLAEKHGKAGNNEMAQVHVNKAEGFAKNAHQAAEQAHSYAQSSPAAPAKEPGKHIARLPVGSHVIHAAGAYAGKVVGHEGEHVHVQKSGEEPRKLLGGMLRPDTARHIDPKSAASAYKGTHAGPLHISSYSEKPAAQAGQHPDLAKNQAAAAAAFNSGKHANMISRVPNPNKGQGWKDPNNTKK